MPYEFVYTFFLTLCPPVFSQLVDPIIDSIEDAKDGKMNKDSWNEDMPLTESDIKRRQIANIYLAFVYIISIGLVFYV